MDNVSASDLWLLKLIGSEQVESIIRDSLSSHPDDVDIVQELSSFYEGSFRLDDAVDLLAREAKRNTSSSSSSRLLELLGKLHLRMHSWTKAEKAFRDALALNQNSTEALNGLGVVALNRGRFQEAETIFYRVIENGASGWRFYYNAVEALTRQGKYEDAVKVMLDGYCRFPQSSGAFSQVTKPNLYEAPFLFEQFTKALDAASKKPGERPYALFLFAIAETYKGNLPEAMRLFQETLALYQPTWSQRVFFMRLWQSRSSGDAHFKCGLSSLDELAEQEAIRPAAARVLFADVGMDPVEYVRNTTFNVNMQLFNNAIAASDTAMELVNIKNGVRRTYGNPETGDVNKLYIVGACQALGAPYIADHHTVASFLQASCNQYSETSSFQVVNLGTPGQIKNFFLKAISCDLRPGDVFVAFSQPFSQAEKDEALWTRNNYFAAMQDVCAKAGARFYLFVIPTMLNTEHPSFRESVYKKVFDWKAPEDLVDRIRQRIPNAFSLFDIVREQREREAGELFLDWTHYTPRLFKRCAERMAEIIRANAGMPNHNMSEECLQNAKASAVWEVRNLIKSNNLFNKELNDWLLHSRDEKISGKREVGAIVMNANPFTKGHQYLVERALENVDGLYVFVVQEDKSNFPFADRIRLVKEGLAHLGDAVTVIPSGDYIISNITFPGYFGKEQAVTPADSTTDIVIFGATIATALNINHRFVGEEPTCMVTADYNKTMQFWLPDMGIQLHTIERKKVDGGSFISASHVRAALEKEDWDLIDRIVPPSTLSYLRTAATARRSPEN